LDLPVTVAGTQPTYVDAVGFSFVIPSIVDRLAVRKTMFEFAVFGALLFLSVGLITLMLYGRLAQRNAYRDRLQKKIDEIRRDVGELSAGIDTVSMIKERLAARRLPSIVVMKMQEAVGSDVALDYFGWDETGKASVRGQAVELTDVFGFESALKKIPEFKDVVSRSTMKKRVGDKEFTSFDIQFSLTGSADAERKKR
jgi:hypothetical protein